MDFSGLINVFLFFLIIISIWIMLGACWGSFRNFFHRKYSFFDCSFIFAYFIEQVLFIILLFKYPSLFQFWVGLFATIVITTASFQNFTWESRVRKIRDHLSIQDSLLSRLRKLLNSIIHEKRKLKEKNEALIDFIDRNFDKIIKE